MREYILNIFYNVNTLIVTISNIFDKADSCHGGCVVLSYNLGSFV